MPQRCTPLTPACSPSGDGIFDVVAGRVDEDPALVPGTALHPDVLVDIAKGVQLPVADHDGCREEEMRDAVYRREIPL